MVGSYTAFEVEAERRREVLADSMRDVRRHQWTVDGSSRETHRPTDAPEGHGLAGIAASLLGRVSQRV